MRLMREIRCFSGAGSSVVLNSWAGTGETHASGAFWTLRAVVEGQVDTATGYLCDIKQIDERLRNQALPALRGSHVASHPGIGSVARGLSQALRRTSSHSPFGPPLTELSLRLSPYTQIEVHMPHTETVYLTQSFEFSAAHRLSCSALSPEENARVFGKCGNPHGHGHNYILEVTVAGEVAEDTGQILDVPSLDRVVRRLVIERFDHRNLNVECSEFAGLNPTVENIARVIWKALHGAVSPARLSRVRVWETPKTYAECTAGEV